MKSAVMVLVGLLLGAGCQVKDARYCGSNADCAPTDGGGHQVCALSRHLCVASVCGSNADCTSPTASLCPDVQDSPPGGGPVQCAPCDTADSTSCQYVQQTSVYADDSTVTAHLNRCITGNNGNVCVECTQASDCPTERPICAGNACRGCQSHDECGGTGPVKCTDGSLCQSFVCISRFESPLLTSTQDGQCALSGTGGQVMYVSGDSTCMATNDGRTPSTPLCDLAATVSKAATASLRYVRIFSASFSLGAPLVVSGQQSLVLVGAPATGHSASVATLSTVAGTSYPLFTVQTGGHLTLDQVNLTQKASDTALITCDSSSLSVRGSVLLGNTGTGMNYGSAAINITNGCDTLVQRNQIGVLTSSDTVAHNIGISVNGSGHSYRIDGNIIVGNQGAGINMGMATPTLADIRFNTIAQNGRSLNGNSFSGGVVCPTNGSATVNVRYSIIAGNLGPSTQVQGQGQTCTITSNVISTSDPVASSLLNSHYRTSAGSVTPVTPTATELHELVTLDIDGNPRPWPAPDTTSTTPPAPAPWDIGASQP